MKDWYVVVEGDPDCPHERFDSYSLAVDPPINVTKCRSCFREIRKDTERPKWPEKRRETPE